MPQRLSLIHMALACPSPPLYSLNTSPSTSFPSPLWSVSTPYPPYVPPTVPQVRSRCPLSSSRQAFARACQDSAPSQTKCTEMLSPRRRPRPSPARCPFECLYNASRRRRQEFSSPSPIRSASTAGHIFATPTCRRFSRQSRLANRERHQLLCNSNILSLVVPMYVVFSNDIP
jgi:hypothetical protein